MIAVLDANILYPAPVRDFLLHLAAAGLYKPAWTAQIQDEWVRSLLKNRPELTRKQLVKTCKAMDGAFPDANIEGYADIITQIKLPDENDRHVLAAAIKARAAVIVTSNIKDFPTAILSKYNIVAMRADDFILQLISHDKTIVQKALENQVALLKNPPRSMEDVMNTLQQCGLHKSIALLEPA
jgi:hypothetical protein